MGMELEGAWCFQQQTKRRSRGSCVRWRVKAVNAIQGGCKVYNLVMHLCSVKNYGVFHLKLVEMVDIKQEVVVFKK